MDCVSMQVVWRKCHSLCCLPGASVGISSARQPTRRERELDCSSSLPYPSLILFLRRCGPRSFCRDSPARPPASSPPSDRPPTSRRRHPTPRRPTQRPRRPTLASKPSTQTTRRDSVRFTSLSAAVSRIGAGGGGAWEARERRSCSSEGQLGGSRKGAQDRADQGATQDSSRVVPSASRAVIFEAWRWSSLAAWLSCAAELWVLGAVSVVLEASSVPRSPTAAQTLTPCCPSRSVSKSEVSSPPSRRPTM